MGAGHAHALYVHEHGVLHRLAPEVKVAFAFGFAFVVALTPREAFWAFGLYALLLAGLIWRSRVRPGFIGLRLVAVVPFVAFALLIPFVAVGEQVDVLGLSLSREGLWSMWNIVAKATIGACTSILLAATTEVPQIVAGLNRLRAPRVLTAIAGFMIRYLELIAEELRRMRVAMTARGYDPRWLWQVRPMASAAGATFVRSYERGERVHAAMLSRGYVGSMPDINRRRASANEWIAGASVFVGAAVVLAIATVTS